MDIIISLDLGTTGNRAIAWNTKGQIVHQCYKEFKQYYPHPGWVEHDAEEIWESCLENFKQVIAHIPHQNVLTIGITNQRETVVMWDTQTGRPLHPAIVWQCRRTEPICSDYRSEEATIKKLTGLPLDPYFSATKIKWLLDTVPHHPNTTKIGTIDSWILWKLTNKKCHLTDTTNASRTLLMDLKSGGWSTELLELFDIPQEMLPSIQTSSSHFGYTDESITGIKISIDGMIGDQQAAFFAQAGSQPGTLKNTYGTGCFLMAGLGVKFPMVDGLITTVALTTSDTALYALEGSIFMGGATIQWLRDNLGLIKSAEETNSIGISCPSSEGVYMVPALTGLGAPHWNPHATGIITGLTRKTTKDHIIRASVESLAYQTSDILDLFSQSIQDPADELWVDGGASNNPFLMQFQADMIQKTIQKPQQTEMTAWGAAGVAGLTQTVWDIQSFLKLKAIDQTYTPHMTPKEAKALLKGWAHAIHQCQA